MEREADARDPAIVKLAPTLTAIASPDRDAE
jgi:hypothetical protein